MKVSSQLLAPAAGFLTKKKTPSPVPTVYVYVCEHRGQKKYLFAPPENQTPIPWLSRLWPSYYTN